MSTFSLRFALLDQQIVDADRRPVGRVDDLELALPTDGGPPVVETVLTGAEALGGRIGTAFGRGMAAAAARLRSSPGPTRIDAGLIAELEPVVRLSAPLSDLPEVAGLEAWLARHVIGPLPGAGDARE